MTLVLTEISEYGISMAADSAVTFSDGQVLIGAQKLLRVPMANAGVSVWGNGTVGKYNSAQGCFINGVSADIWLQNFINSHITENMSISAIAKELEEGINEAFGSVIPTNMGFHIAGFEEEEGKKGPAFYHVHNGHLGYVINGNGRAVQCSLEPTGVQTREFESSPDCTPKRWKELQADGCDTYITMNGAFLNFRILKDAFEKNIFPLLRELSGLRFPYPSNLQTRGEYMRFWINLVTGIYRISNLYRPFVDCPPTIGAAGIGGPITVLTISDSGLQEYYAK